MPERTFAMVVGVSRYDVDPAWDIDAPRHDAILVAQRLRGLGAEVFLYVDLTSQDDDKKSIVTGGADFDSITNCWETHLATGVPPGSNLIVYWAGHGITHTNDHQLLFCRDYCLTPKGKKRVIDANVFLNSLRTKDYAHFRQQMIFIDACRNRRNDLEVSPAAIDYRPTESPDQATFFAVRDGEYARPERFTSAVLRAWGNQLFPDADDLTDRLLRELQAQDQDPFRLRYRTKSQQDEREFGARAANVGGRFSQLMQILKALPLDDAAFRRHYLRVIAGLRQPALYQAHSVEEMVRELSRLGAPGAQNTPRPLVEFLMRLPCPELSGWLRDHASANDRATVQDKLQAERQALTLHIELEEDRQNRPGELAAYDPRLHREESGEPVPFDCERKPVKRWDEFEREFPALVQEAESRAGGVALRLEVAADLTLLDQQVHRWDDHMEQPVGTRLPVTVRLRNRELDRLWVNRARDLRETPGAAMAPLPLASKEELRRKAAPHRGPFLLQFPIQKDSLKEQCPACAALRCLLNLGVPMMCWLHAEPPTCWADVEALSIECLSDGVDSFAEKLWRKRESAADALSETMTLFWDDPDRRAKTAPPPLQEVLEA